MKACTLCGSTENTFGKDKRSKDGLQARCTKCQGRHRKDRNRRIVDEARDVPCMDCGVKHPLWRMQFDHRDGTEKVACVSELISMGTLNRLLVEIAKCDVVCANCHCDRTHRRKK